MGKQINIIIEQQDALAVTGDVLALKFSHDFFGVDAAARKKLQKNGIDITDRMPHGGDFAVFDTKGAIAATQILFIGVGYLYEFGYKNIREFSRLVLESLVNEGLETQRLVVTLHGAGYGLDEVEAFESEVAGFVDGITAGHYPKTLHTIVFAERNPSRAERLKVALKELLPDQGIAIPGFSDPKALGPRPSDRLRGVGYDSGSKAHVFVAMPFEEEMDDVYHYGIQGAVKAAGFLCERADLSSFTGDVMNWVRQRIDSATLVIADLSGANANVYLEVGYAWGCKRPTVFLVRDENDLKFDVKGQRCLVYKKIKDLEDKLQKELEQLKKSTLNHLVI